MWRDGKTLVDDALLLDPMHGPLAERLGRFEALATLFLAGPLFARARDEIRLQIDAAPIAAGSRTLAAASPIGDDSLLVRLAARSIEELLTAVRGYLAFVPVLLGDDPWARRN